MISPPSESHLSAWLSLGWKWNLKVHLWLLVDLRVHLRADEGENAQAIAPSELVFLAIA